MYNTVITMLNFRQITVRANINAAQHYHDVTLCKCNLLISSDKPLVAKLGFYNTKG